MLSIPANSASQSSRMLLSSAQASDLVSWEALKTAMFSPNAVRQSSLGLRGSRKGELLVAVRMTRAGRSLFRGEVEM
jgi:hypothetical protein